MALNFNGLSYNTANNLICFSDVPNILTLEDDAGGTYGNFRFIIKDGLYAATTGTSQWWISFLGETVSNVMNPEDAINKNFYISQDKHSTAASLCKALRNCPSIAAKFQIYLDDNVSLNGHLVWLKAREIGKAWNNLPDELSSTPGLMSTYIGYAGNNGNAYSPYYNSKIDVDVYVNDEYTTTMEKTFTGDKCSFDITPVINTISKVGNTVPFKLHMSYINSSGSCQEIATIPSGSSVYNYASVGYMVNQGEKYLVNNGLQLAQNVSRGADRSSEGLNNNTILYVYRDSFPISFYRGNTGGINVTLDYVDSAGNVITSDTGTWSSTSSTQVLVDYVVTVRPYWLTSSVYYLDLTLGNKKIRYNVIKPRQMTEHCQRIYFRNSYGGISFIDMCGPESMTKDIENETYNKNNFDYYTSDSYSKEKIYNTTIKNTYTLKSHLIEGDGRWIYNDLAKSPLVWTEINGEKCEIIVDSISVDEVTTGNNVYEAQVKFHMSDPNF